MKDGTLIFTRRNNECDLLCAFMKHMKWHYKSLKEAEGAQFKTDGGRDISAEHTQKPTKDQVYRENGKHLSLMGGRGGLISLVL